MIDRDEIELRAKDFDIHPVNIERDYVFGWLLAGIYGDSPLANELVLKGGNCLRKAYFERTRFSTDLDFSVEHRIDPARFLVELNRVCDLVQACTGVAFHKDRNKVEEKFALDNERLVYHAKLYFTDFYGNPDAFVISVRLDLTEMDRLYLPIQERNLIHPYSDVQETRVAIRCMKLEEILGSKLKCLLQRRQTQDLYDFLFSFVFNRNLAINRREVVTAFLKKTIFEPSPGVAKTLLLELPLEVLRRVWTKYLICPKESVLDFDSAVQHFRTHLDAVFGEAPQNRFASVSYFPSHLRNPIIEAGNDMKLVAFTYHGRRRDVEPYSLMFKRRKDGFGQEYFYGYDRTGGQSSGPGIKTFVAPDIQQLEILGQTFQPQFEVELAKAGEPGDKSYFGRSFGGHRTSSAHRKPSVRRARRISSYSLRYIIECPYCQKRFSRSSFSTQLNEHKDRYGNQCHGRVGHLVDQRY